ncbi:DNA repair protein RecN [Thalassotalea sp. LPB0316]|uniref:DNA repair protein RecN n=1 Tax=Thalassotalea sp. LPB0316 TaxID=2769490 RepID=UPI00186791E2|nr:DNA repair protein RecN [Thalassotalea sp. LPB0316]QOL25294.1 DNA repair protein RecN [Thalassotalea sp. LPB0316]
MLTQLTITNFAIVKQLELDWRSGMTTITGETGAGKSIAIDALGLCLGDRATTNVVRPNTPKADLSATFDIKNNTNAKQWLLQHDLICDDDCILRRVISSEGRSKAYINGSPVPLTQLREIGRLLINIHGQHDHQLIVKATEQRKLLDGYAKHQNLLDDVSYYAKKWSALSSELETLKASQTQREAEQQLLQYQVKELDEFAITEGEFETLENDYKKFSNSQSILQDSLFVLEGTSENEQFNVLDVLRQSVDRLSQYADLDQDIANISNTYQEALIQLEDACQDLRHFHDRLELDPEQYQLIEDRYSSAINLARKHQVAPESLHVKHQELQQALANISGDDTRQEQIYRELDATKAEYDEAAQRLHESRQVAASQLSQLITQSIRELNMPHGQFSVAVTKKPSETLNGQGSDEIVFLVSINPGQAQEAMHKVASGGELSRISLAMQVILADKVTSPALIFDEVDVGISGPTAAMVGEKLKQLAKNTQVICVTHLPQVACKGHQQYFVAKLTDGEHTETTVTELSKQARVQEIARLLAGDKISEHSLANATELLAS